MDNSDVFKGLEKHQGKWMTVYEGKLVVAPAKDKLYQKVPSSYKAKQIPHMFQGSLAWRVLVKDAVAELVRQEEHLKREQVQVAAVRAADQQEVVEMDLETEDIEQDRTPFWKRLFGKKRTEYTAPASFSE